MSGIDERSEKKANELEEEAWERARQDQAWVAADTFSDALDLYPDLAKFLNEKKEDEK